MKEVQKQTTFINQFQMCIRDSFCDGDRGSFWHSGAYGQPGDWYGVDYGMPIPVRSVEVLMGRNDKDVEFCSCSFIFVKLI